MDTRLSGRNSLKSAIGFSLCLLLTVWMWEPLTKAQAQKAQPTYRIAFGSGAPYNTDIFIADADGSNAKPLAPDPALDYNASFSFDGRWIVFTSHRSGPAEIYRIHPDGSSIEKLTNDRAFDDQATLSPDGRLLAYVSSRSGEADIWILDLQTHKSRNLTNHPAGDFRPAWSPDGQWIAFSSDRDPPERPCDTFTGTRRSAFVRLQLTGIYILHPDGSGLRRITNANRLAGTPHWSPDSSHLVFYDADVLEECGVPGLLGGVGTTQIVSVDLQTGTRKTLTSGAEERVFPRWLRDGRTAFVVRGEHQGIAFTPSSTSSGTSDSQKIEGEFGAPDWSPDLRKMVFHREVNHSYDLRAHPGVQEWYSRDPRFKLQRTSTALVASSYSPQGGRGVHEIATGLNANDVHGLAVTNTDGSGGKIIFEDTIKEVRGTTWSPAGDWIAFGYGAFFGRADTGPARVMVIRPDGTGLKAVTKTDQNAGMPSWSPDGNHIAYRFATGSKRGLAILDVGTGESHVLNTGSDRDTFPSWSPRGDWITFTRFRDGNYEICIVHPDGTGLKQLTNLVGINAHSAFSQDGEWIVFATSGGGFKDESILALWNFQPYGEIAVLRVDGSDLHNLTDNATEEGAPSWVF